MVTSGLSCAECKSGGITMFMYGRKSCPKHLHKRAHACVTHLACQI
jgi:hypothetical protein